MFFLTFFIVLLTVLPFYVTVADSTVIFAPLSLVLWLSNRSVPHSQQKNAPTRSCVSQSAPKKANKLTAKLGCCTRHARLTDSRRRLPVTFSSFLITHAAKKSLYKSTVLWSNRHFAPVAAVLLFPRICLMFSFVVLRFAQRSS